MKRRSLFNVMRLALLIASLPLGAQFAHAGPGLGYSTDINGNPIQVPTYYANSVSIPTNPVTGLGAQNMRKFVDGLPGLGSAQANNLGQYLPVAVPEKWVNGNGVVTNDDYYELGIVEYSERMHSDLPKATTLRGYVQIETPGLFAAGKSAHIALKYPNGNPILNAAGAQIYGVDKAHYLGPIIVATRNTAVRVKYSNLLPTGGFANGQRNGDLFLPVDKTLMGAGLGPDGTSVYTENRAEIHLHGGDNPWISDGTPHQWTVPAGENTPFKTGASYQNVPDMPDPGPGSGTLYYPNGDNARLMFYHDHAAGITRLNVYAGEAAGYLLTDQPNTGENLLPLPAVQIPLVIQEKTYVPSDVAVQDVKWDQTHWGQPGDLWYPHVYEFNQDPNSFDGTNPVGRWDFGPYFWPVYPVSNTLPTGEYGNATMTPEDFGDTPVINGTAYPVLKVDPTAYRLRILNASNSRMFNLGLYVADPTTVSSDGRTNTEVKMVPSAPPTTTSIPRACKAADPVNPTTGLQVSAANETIGGVLVPAGTTCWPATWPTDGRDGGVPDPATAGPKMIQIGTEGGMLPNAVVIPSNPTNYEYMRRSVTVLNVSDHGLFLASAERADVVVDFSQYAGKTLIVYNDMAAPVPAFDARIDYYTGDPDQTGSGGWFSTPIGFGPNTRTIMQIVVSGTTNGTQYNSAALISALPAVFAANQPKPIVAEAAFNTALGTSYTNTYARIFTGSASNHNFTFTAGDTFSYYPEGSTTLTTVTAGQTAVVPVLNKAIQELFDTYGRMNATLGVEVPFTNQNIQTTVPLGYIDPATESISDGETQIWKITHNGVDTHPVHFHLVNVQVINRIGWDGTVKPPNANEVGWKETVRMNPLEDVIVAVRAKQPVLPGFGLPHSVRALDPTQAIGATMGFSNLDPLTGNAMVPAVTNQVTDFGWEYVWHCHILGHEENDFMRPFIFKVTDTVPAAPGSLAGVFSIVGSNSQVLLTWVDNSNNEIGFKVQRATVSSKGVVGTYTALGTTLANATSFTDTTAVPGTVYSYMVSAFNVAGSAASLYSFTTPQVLTAPTWISVPATRTITTVPVSYGPTNVAGATYVIQQSSDPTFATVISQQSTTATTFSFTNVLNGSYYYRVKATKAGYLDSTWIVSTLGTVTFTPPAPSWILAPATASNITVSWGVASTLPGTSYVVQESNTLAFATITGTATVTTTSTTFTGRANGTYYYRVMTVIPGYPNSGWTTSTGTVVNVTAPASPWISVPATRTVVGIPVTWGASTLAGVTYTVQESTSLTFTTITRSASTTATTYTFTGETNGTYYYRVQATFPGMNASTWTVSTACISNVTTAASPWIYVYSPAAGNVSVQWGASPQAGVSYTVQESKSATFGTITAQVVTAGTSNLFTGRTTGTYYYRVKATYAGFNDSTWTSSTGFALP